MKKFILLITFLSLASASFAQKELYAEEGISIDMGTSAPMFSLLAEDIFGGEFYLPEFDLFNKEFKQEVNMVGLMEKERRLKDKKYDFDAPNFLKKNDPGTLNLSKDVQLYGRGSNYDIYTGKKKNPVYEEMRPRIFNDYYSPFYARRSPYYSPYFR